MIQFPKPSQGRLLQDEAASALLICYRRRIGHISEHSSDSFRENFRVDWQAATGEHYSDRARGYLQTIEDAPASSSFLWVDVPPQGQDGTHGKHTSPREELMDGETQSIKVLPADSGTKTGRAHILPVQQHPQTAVLNSLACQTFSQCMMHKRQNTYIGNTDYIAEGGKG